MDVLQQATYTLSPKSAFATQYSGVALGRPLRMVRLPAQRSRTTVPLYSHNPNESERMMLANSNTSYAAPLAASSGSSFSIRPLAEILRDLNKRVPDQYLKYRPGSAQQYIPWYQANRMLSFNAPGWCGEVRDIAFSDDGKFVTVVYRVTIRGSDGEVYREALGTACVEEAGSEDPTQVAEATAFVRACARFGLGLYLHHGEEL